MDKRLSPVYRNKMCFVEENLERGVKLLDVGCGEGHYFSLYEARNIDFKGVDVDYPAIQDVYQCSAETLPFDDACFDFVVCMDVLEHIDDYRKAIKEIHRVLKKGGTLILSVPNQSFPWTYDPVNAFLRLLKRHILIGMWAWGHKRLFTEAQITEEINTYDFEIIKTELRSHAFLAATINYLPYLLQIFKKKGYKKETRLEKGVIYKAYDKINEIDKKHFSWTNPINICIKAIKR